MCTKVNYTTSNMCNRGTYSHVNCYNYTKSVTSYNLTPESICGMSDTQFLYLFIHFCGSPYIHHVCHFSLSLFAVVLHRGGKIHLRMTFLCFSHAITSWFRVLNLNKHAEIFFEWFSVCRSWCLQAQLNTGFFCCSPVVGYVFYELVFSIHCIQYCGKWWTRLARLSRKVTTILQLTIELRLFFKNNSLKCHRRLRAKYQEIYCNWHPVTDHKSSPPTKYRSLQYNCHCCSAAVHESLLSPCLCHKGKGPVFKSKNKSLKSVETALFFSHSNLQWATSGVNKPWHFWDGDWMLFGCEQQRRDCKM